MKTLGELEARIMAVLWRAAGPATVRDVHSVLQDDGPIAYTTVMTVMDRLWRKRFLDREARGRAYEYVPALSEAEHTANLMHELLSSTRDRRGALAHFVRGMRKRDEAELVRLTRTVPKRKPAR